MLTNRHKIVIWTALNVNWPKRLCSFPVIEVGCGGAAFTSYEFALYRKSAAQAASLAWEKRPLYLFMKTVLMK